MVDQYIQPEFVYDQSFQTLKFNNITNESTIPDKIDNLKFMNFFIFSSLYKMDDEKTEIIKKFIKVDNFDKDKYYILLSIINYKELTLNLENDKDKEKYSKIVVYLKKLEENKPALFYKLIELDSNQNTNETYSMHYTIYHKVPMFLYLLDMFFTRDERENSIQLLNNLIYNTTHNDELITNLTDFSYNKLFKDKPRSTFKYPPSDSNLPTSKGFGESSTNDYATAPADVYVSPVLALNALTAPTLETSPPEATPPQAVPSAEIPAVKVDTDDICREFETSNATQGAAAAAPQ